MIDVHTRMSVDLKNLDIIRYEEIKITKSDALKENAEAAAIYTKIMGKAGLHLDEFEVNLKKIFKLIY